MKISIDREACAGYGRCYVLAAGLFHSDDDGFGVVSVDIVPPEQANRARAAVIGCPEGAISVEE